MTAPPLYVCTAASWRTAAFPLVSGASLAEEGSPDSAQLAELVAVHLALESVSRSVTFSSLQPHGLCSPWNSPSLKTRAVPFSRGSSQHRDQTQVSHIAGRFFISWATRKANVPNIGAPKYIKQIDIMGETYGNIIMAGDFKNPLTSMGRLRQKFSNRNPKW